MRKAYDEDKEVGMLRYIGKEVERGDGINWDMKPEHWIYEDEPNFPEPECGDILYLAEMPFDQNGRHATGYAIYGCIWRDGEESAYGFEPQYES